MSRARFHCNRVTTEQDIQEYASLFFWHTVYIIYIVNEKKEPGYFLSEFSFYRMLAS